MVDQILAFVVVMAPTIFAIGIEVIDKQTRETPKWRVGIIAFGIALSGLTLWQQTSERRASAKDRETAIKETSKQVAAETSKQVTAAVTEQFKQTIADQTGQITDLKKQLAAQGKDVSAIKGSNIVTGKNPVKVLITNPPAAPDKEAPLPSVSWSQESGGLSEGMPVLMIHFRVGDFLKLPAFIAVCDRPCKTIGGMVSGTSQASYLAASDAPNVAGIVFNIPKPLPPGVDCSMQIVPTDGSKTPITAMSFRILKESEVSVGMK